MGTKTLLLDGVTGAVIPGVAANSFEVTDPTNFLTVKVEGLAEGDYLNLVRENYAADGFEPVTMNGHPIQLNRGNTSATPAEKGVYALESPLVAGTVTAYTEV